ncbi:hypothetical protein K0U27_04855 [archaeon]|nr:hypothetical protein [archaeon]
MNHNVCTIRLTCSLFVIDFGFLRIVPLVKIQNIVPSINLGGKVSLEQVVRVLLRSMYESEQFPGMIHMMLDSKTVILIFASGKIVCVDAKYEAAIHRHVNSIHSELEQKNLMVYE